MQAVLLVAWVHSGGSWISKLHNLCRSESHRGESVLWNKTADFGT